MNTQHLLNDQLVSVLDKYSLPGQRMGQDLIDLVRNSESQELVIPVLGIQGVGKSTLINAILKEDIMPNEADETTCAPVEVKFGETEEAEVYFIDKSAPVSIRSKEDLYQYVDNNENPGNIKQVERVVLYRKNNLLKNGLTIVDLPGVGSLTRENEKTTRRYIENLCTALFVLPTVPTIRKTEALFIKSVWAQFPMAFFVQNRWVGESDLAVSESVPYNILKLKQIAEQLNNPFDEHIVVVNAYDAILGSLNGNKEIVMKSNIGELIGKIEDYSTSWKDSLSEAICGRIKNTLSFIQMRISERIDSIHKTKEEKQKERDALLRSIELENADIEKLLVETQKELTKERKETDEFIKQMVSEYSGSIKADIHRVIDKGTTDGQKLTDAFNDVQEKYAEVLFDAVFTKICELKSEIEKRIAQYNEVINIEDDMNSDSVLFEKKRKHKYENGLGLILDMGGAYGGYAAGTAAAAAITGGKIGASLGSLAGPLGTAVGLLAGVTVGMAAGWISHKVTKHYSNKRGSKTKVEIDGAIAESASRIKSQVLSKFEEYFEKANSAFDRIRSARSEQYQAVENDMSYLSDEEQVPVLEEDLALVDSANRKIKTILR